MELCKKLQLDEDTYSISIPLGSTVNMAGAAITISTMALAAATTLGIEVSFGTALIMCVLAAASAAGASGVAGGSLLLIPLACSLFNIPNDIAMQGRRRWFHHRRYPGLLRDRYQFFHRRTLYRLRRNA